jgi:DNA polymerase V
MLTSLPLPLPLPLSAQLRKPSERITDVLLPHLDPPRLAIPLGLAPVSAGFPSPAEDYEDQRLDIHDYLVRNPVSTFYFPVAGDSMEGAEIFTGDILVVDRSIAPCHGHIVVAFVNGERLVKRFFRRGGRVALLAENPFYPPLELTEGTELVVWGVVIGKFKRLPA